MNIHDRDPLEPKGGTETPEDVALNRRRFIKKAGIWGAGIAAAGGLGYAGWQWYRGSDEEVLARGRTGRQVQYQPGPLEGKQGQKWYPAPLDERFTYGRPETAEAEAARYTNFYEFSSFKSNWRLVDGFKTDPWTVTIDGLCRQPMKLSFDELLKQFSRGLTERQYRHRCVETWAMAIPWTGIPLADVIKAADPKASATHVRFVSFNRPEQAPGMLNKQFPWPYTEGLTLAEATNELTLLATGMYGHPLLKQHGAPVRLVVPWKYGFKSIKSIERIELVDREPATFWTTLMPQAYPFQSNVEPQVPRPWPQDSERMLGTDTPYPTQLYNGYAKYVAGLYQA